ncbi:hypothetical protein [Bacillus mycoides]|uniref:hypothetical protein n=1 Tax=Bacillus mycoides TaxID=1405 RepID=UPI0010BE9B83|nr:hypothetical protein [Bacillus mycoides]
MPRLYILDGSPIKSRSALFKSIFPIFSVQNTFLARVIFALGGLSGLMCLMQLFQAMKDAI